MRTISTIFISLMLAAVVHAEEGAAPKAETKDKKTTEKAETKEKKTAEKTDTKKGKKVTDKAALPATVTDLVKKDTVQGTGAEAKAGDEIEVNYTGWIYDPSQPDGRTLPPFDSSVGKAPFKFKLGQGMVIKGWDQGFDKMKEKGKRTLIIPAAMGYGERGAGKVIPPNANLIFDVELLKIIKN